jgi:hypothetical protein
MGSRAFRAVNVVRDFGTTVEVSGGAAGSSKQLFEIELCHLLQVIDKWPG